MSRILFLKFDIVIEESVNAIACRRKLAGRLSAGEKSWIFHTYRPPHRSNCQTSRNNSEKFVNLPCVHNVYTAWKYRPSMLNLFVVFVWFTRVHQVTSLFPKTSTSNLFVMQRQYKRGCRYGDIINVFCEEFDSKRDRILQYFEYLSLNFCTRRHLLVFTINKY